MYVRAGLLLLVLTLPSFTFAQSTCPTLSLGSTGPSVIAVQKILYDAYEGFPTPTGYFGSITQAAVEQWQTEHKIVSSGSAATTGWGAVGPKTRAAMGISCASNTSSTAGGNTSTGGVTSGSKVALIQALLAQVKILQDKIAAIMAGNASTTIATSTVISTTPILSVGCTFNGQSVAHGSTVTAYQSSSVAYGSTCTSQSRTCSNGTLSGSYTYGACSVGAAASCTLNGAAVASGASVTAYQAATVAYGQQCVSEQRSCANGVPSGSYTYVACEPSSSVPNIVPEYIVTITAKPNLKYVRARIDGASDLLASQSGVATWETYDQVDAGDGYVAFLSRANNKYVSVQGGDTLTATADSIGPWEKFKIIGTGDGHVALQSQKNNMYVTAENAGVGSLVANSDTIGEWQKFVVSQVVDIWEAATAFANNFPDDAKNVTESTGIAQHRERMYNGDLYMIELFGGNWIGPGAVPVWNLYGLQMIDGWQVFTSWKTVPSDNPGATWNIPRAVRYLIPYISQESPHVTAPRTQIGWDCSQTQITASAEEWGNHSAAYMQNLGHDMGNRWVIDLQYKDAGEIWTIDLGPSTGVFAPLYGVVGYTDGNFNRRWLAAITTSPNVTSWDRCHQ